VVPEDGHSLGVRDHSLSLIACSFVIYREATWFSFVPLIDEPQGWSMDKLGMAISPYEVCVNGSRALHAVWSGVSYAEGGLNKLNITTLDAPLVAPGNATLLVFDNAQPACENGMHFNLHNNLWNTKCAAHRFLLFTHCASYPVWYNGNECFRFSLQFAN
jgi:hypothetical protein